MDLKFEFSVAVFQVLVGVEVCKCNLFLKLRKLDCVETSANTNLCIIPLYPLKTRIISCKLLGEELASRGVDGLIYLRTYFLTYILIYLFTFLHTYLLTYLLHGVESFLKTKRFSGSQEIPRIFLEPEGSSPHSQVPATCPYPESARSNPYPPHPTS